MADVCCSCGREMNWVDFYRCEKCDGNVCEECIVHKDDLQLCRNCAGEAG